MARWIALSAAIGLAVALPARAYVPPADNCADPVTYQTPDDLSSSPSQPQTGQQVTYTYAGDPAYVQPGTMVFTVTTPSGSITTLRPATADGQSVTYTPRDPGGYNIDASWQGKNCNNPEQYGTGSASLNQQVTSPPDPTPVPRTGGGPCPSGQVTRDDGTCGPRGEPLSQSLEASAVPAYVQRFGVKAIHVLPRSCKSAGVQHRRNLNVSPPGKPNPSGVWVAYGPGTKSVDCPQVFAFKKPLSLIRSLLIGHMKDYVKLGGNGNASSIRVGRYSVTVINVISAHYADFVWRQDGVTYSVEVRTKNGVPTLGGLSIKKVIASLS